MSIKQIDELKCVGCNMCVNSCAMDVIRLNRSPFKTGEITPCRSACPAGVDIRGYISLLRQERYEEAIELIREALPMPAVTGHVCFHPCEKVCAREDIDEAVNINALERYISDYWLRERAKPPLRIYLRKTAIIGSGPAGLAAAYELVRMGYPVTIFEANPLAGGMLRAGIPDYRLPADVLDAQIAYIEDMGIEIKTGISIGRDVTIDDLRREGYEAILFAIGAQLSRKIILHGADLDGVLWGLDFLREKNLKRNIFVKDRVVVIGGGNVAVDAALTALRLGGRDVRIVCIEGRNEMPAHQEGLRTVEEEGVEINTSWGPKAVIGEGGKVMGIELMRCLSVFDEAGRFQPSYDETTSLFMEADTVIFAIGENTDLSSLPRDIKTADGHIIADPVTLETNVPGVFAAGVVVHGPGSVVEAIASGKKAAVSIDRYLRGDDLKAGREVETLIVKPPREGVEKQPRQPIVSITVEDRKGSFREIKTSFSPEMAEREGRRCMACGSRAYIVYPYDCMTCYTCERDCPEKAIYVSPEHVSIGVLSWG
jgi:NADPH-dependent glutamate synthase beta subunit-like oxidoreductase/NAD-dependent dihydropyrimidine dehydrogenase PreA subunit